MQPIGSKCFLIGCCCATAPNLNVVVAGLDPNTILKENWSLLLLAASVGKPEITKLLIERGADVNYDKGMCYYFLLL